MQLYVVSFGYLVLFLSTPLCLHEFVTMHSIKLAMESIGRKKFTAAMRV